MVNFTGPILGYPWGTHRTCDGAIFVDQLLALSFESGPGSFSANVH